MDELYHIVANNNEKIFENELMHRIEENLHTLFIKSCKYGHSEVAQWLWKLSLELGSTSMFSLFYFG